jgi:hypothetical protein
MPEQVIKLLGERLEPSEEIFKSLDYNGWNNFKIREWVMKAGINKQITFHCARCFAISKYLCRR